MEAKRHFSRRGAEAQRRWDEGRYFEIQIFAFFIFLKLACLGASSGFHIKNLCASAPLRETFLPSANSLLLSAKFQHAAHRLLGFGPEFLLQ